MVGTVDGHVTICTLGLQIESGRRTGRKPGVELRYLGVAAVTELAHFLKLEHVPIGAAMRAVAGRAAFHTRSPVFEHKGPGQLGMTVTTALLKPTHEAAKAGCYRWIVRVVTGGAGDPTRRKPMTFIKRELRGGVLMTTNTLGYSRQRILCQFFVADII